MCDSNHILAPILCTPLSNLQADDGFVECPSESCAHDSCLEFFAPFLPARGSRPRSRGVYDTDLLVGAAQARRALPRRRHRRRCRSSIATPPPPSPPPPRPYLEVRTRDGEQGYDLDCQLISYAQCKNIVADYAAETEGVLDVLRVSAAPCEGLGDEPSCFLGCQYGQQARRALPLPAARHAGRVQRVQLVPLRPGRDALLRVRQPGIAAAGGGTRRRRPLCTPRRWHAQASYVIGETPVLGGGVTDSTTPWTSDDGQVSALTKRLVNGRTIDLALRSSHRVVDCPGNDDAEQTCARFCGQEHLGFLRAFAVTGARHTPPPPISPVPYSAPSPPRPPWNPFSECLNTCEENDVLAVGDAKCRDGGKGAFLPTLCEYSTHCRHCGFRENTNVIVSDDSCAHANNGVCQDGGVGSSFQAEDGSLATEASRTCAVLGTDATDCAIYGARTTQEIGVRPPSRAARMATRPAPPPPLPNPPSPSPPPPPVVAACVGCRAYFRKNEDHINYEDGSWNTHGRYEFSHVCVGTDVQCGTLPPHGPHQPVL